MLFSQGHATCVEARHVQLIVEIMQDKGARGRLLRGLHKCGHEGRSHFGAVFLGGVDLVDEKPLLRRSGDDEIPNFAAGLVGIPDERPEAHLRVIHLFDVEARGVYDGGGTLRVLSGHVCSLVLAALAAGNSVQHVVGDFL